MNDTMNVAALHELLTYRLLTEPGLADPVKKRIGQIESCAKAMKSKSEGGYTVPCIGGAWAILEAVAAYVAAYSKLPDDAEGLFQFAYSSPKASHLSEAEMRQAWKPLVEEPPDLSLYTDIDVLIDQFAEECGRMNLLAICDEIILTSVQGPDNAKKPASKRHKHGVRDAISQGIELLQEARAALAGEAAVVNTTRADKIEPKQLEWLWKNKFPAWKMSLACGTQGSAKSMFTIDLAARVTTGSDFPDGEKNTLGARDVLFATTEDDWQDTIVPRLMAAGADLSKIHRLDDVTQTATEEGMKATYGTLFRLKDHTEALRRKIESLPGLALIVFDPLTAFYGDVDANKDAEIRPVLEALAKTCAETKVTFLGVVHYNKRTDASAVQKIMGGSSIAGIVRAAWGFSKDKFDPENDPPENKGLCTMAEIKANLSSRHSGLKYRTVSTSVTTKDGVVIKDVGRMEWLGETDEDADDVMDRQREKVAHRGENTKFAAARLLIKSKLGGGKKEPAFDMYRLGDAEGISGTVMYRALQDLGGRTDGGKPALWSLPVNGNGAEHAQVVRERVRPEDLEGVV